MGGAFTGVGGDVHGVYWNPAGLTTVTAKQFTWTSFMTNLEAINYDNFFAFVLPLGEKQSYSKGLPHQTLGLAVVLDENISYPAKFVDRYFTLSYGFPVGKSSPLSFGVNLKMIYNRVEFLYEVGNEYGYDNMADSAFLIDFGLLFQPVRSFSLGLLVQNANEASSLGATFIRNVRPGLAWNITPSTTLTLEVYDLLGKSDDEENDVARNLRLGFESWLGPNFAFRCGGYNVNGDDPGAKAITAGIGCRVRNWEINYTLMDFYKLRGDEVCHMAGLTHTF